MSARSRVLILLHEHDGYPGRKVGQVWTMAQMWRAEGIEVLVAKGLDDPEAGRDVDLILPHLNVSVTPPEYRSWLDRQPNVLNPRVYDISKRAISQGVVSREDSYEGPVVVKTDLNYGGLPEWAMAQRARNATLAGKIRRRLVGKRALEPPRHGTLESASVLPSLDYQVFDTKGDVPPGVWDNSALVVERFLPERRGDLFLLRAYLFLGDRYISELRGGPNPIVKGPGQTLRETCEPHPGILAKREELGWDYGKFDFAVRNDEVVLYDANRTPGAAGTPERTLARSQILAPGIRSVLERAKSNSLPRTPNLTP